MQVSGLRCALGRWGRCYRTGHTVVVYSYRETRIDRTPAPVRSRRTPEAATRATRDHPLFLPLAPDGCRFGPGCFTRRAAWGATSGSAGRAGPATVTLASDMVVAAADQRNAHAPLGPPPATSTPRSASKHAPG